MGTGLAGKVVVVTGGARGIGAATGRALATQGARVALLDVDGDAVGETASSIGPAALGMAADVADPKQLEDAAGVVADRYGGIDAVVANAGIAGPTGAFLAGEQDSFERTIEVNLFGATRTARATLPHLVERAGYLLLVASMAASTPSPLASAYGTSKAGVAAFGRALRLELAPRGVDVGVAFFGTVDTDMYRGLSAAGFGDVASALPGPLGRTITSEDAAAALVEGVARRRRTVYAPGWVRGVVGMQGPLSSADRLLARVPAMARLLEEA